MTEQEFRRTLAENLAKYRKLNGLTQDELAGCINYSGKSVSKWERGDGVPDVFVLLTMSELYGISLSELVGQHSMSKSSAAQLKKREKSKRAKDKAKKKIIDRAAKQKRKESKKK